MFLRRLVSPIALVLPVVLALTGCSTLHQITIIPDTVAFSAVGQTAQLSAYGTSQQGSANSTTDNITNSVTWASSIPAIATVSPSGLVTAQGAAGTTVITASSDGIVATASVTVTLGSGGTGSGSPTITITPSTATDTFIGETTQFIATGSLNGASQNITTQVTWASSNTQVASISGGGLATAVGAGTTTITASSGGIIGTATLTVTTGTSANATLAIVPASGQASFVGETTQFIALGNLTGGAATQDLTSNVTWSSSDVAVATIDKNGLATAVAANTIPESTTITAIGTTTTGSLITATAQLTVQSAGGTVTLPALSVYTAGAGTGTITATVGTAPATITCGSPSGTTCTANFPRYSVVTLTATTTGHFGGWSSNCVPVVGTPLSCTIQMTNNETVGAVFNP